MRKLLQITFFLITLIILFSLNTKSSLAQGGDCYGSGGTCIDPTVTSCPTSTRYSPECEAMGGGVTDLVCCGAAPLPSCPGSCRSNCVYPSTNWGLSSCSDDGIAGNDACCINPPAESSCSISGIMSGDVPYLRYGECLFERLVSAVLGLAGFALFIMLIIGGFKYMTAGGDPKGLESAKQTLTYAIGGLILLAASYLFLLLIGAITGAGVTNFVIFRE